MNTYMVFRAVVPPSFNMDEYAKHSGEPIRFDCVTVVEAESGMEAVNTVIAATGIIATGMFAVEGELYGFGSKRRFGQGGALRSKPERTELEPAPLSEREARERIQKLEDDIARLGNE